MSLQWSRDAIYRLYPLATPTWAELHLSISCDWRLLCCCVNGPPGLIQSKPERSHWDRSASVNGLLGTLRLKFLCCGLPHHKPSLITGCLHRGLTFILEASRASSGIIAWQLLLSKIHTHISCWLGTSSQLSSQQFSSVPLSSPQSSNLLLLLYTPAAVVRAWWLLGCASLRVVFLLYQL